MSRYFSLILLLVSLSFFGCSMKREVHIDMVKVDTNRTSANDYFMTLEALLNQYYDVNQTRALQIYKKMYKKNGELLYLLEAIGLSFQDGDTASRDELLDDGLKKFPKNKQIKKFQVSRLVQDKKYKKAKKIMYKIIKKDRSSDNYMMLGSICYLQKQYKKALYYYNKAYKLVSNEKSLLKIATLLDENLHKTKKAIEYLESYIRLKDASKEVYFKLLHIYSKKLNVRGLISTYKLLYRDFGDSGYAKKVVELYMYDKNRRGAIRFLNKSGYNPLMLMDMYAQDRRFTNAYRVAKKMYKKTGEVDYLGRMAIYQYEANQKNMTKKILKSISKKFDEVIERKQLPMYLNYYGYLLIDHKLDVKKGIRYVKMALEREPDSIYYIDSLAWGYYREGECEKALEQIKKIVDKSNEKEIKEHFNAIKKCTKGKK